MNKELVELEKAIDNISTTDILHKQELINLIKKFNYKKIIDPKQKEEVLRRINNCMYQSIVKRFSNILGGIKYEIKKR